MGFYLDEHLSPRIAAIARRMGVDVISTPESGRNGESDELQLLFAAEQGRTIVTKNFDDFSRLTISFAAERQPHAGVLLVPESLPGQDYAGIAAAIARYEREHPDGMPPYMLDYLVPSRR